MGAVLPNSGRDAPGPTRAPHPKPPGRFLERGGLWVLGQAGLLALSFCLGLIYAGNAPWSTGFWPGGLVLILGGWIALAGVARLRSRLTPFPEPSRNSQLVRGGVYALMRHPLYTSLVVTALGWALFRQSWAALMVTPVLALFFDAKARCEERLLRERFPGYAEYERKVRRFIPWIY